MNEINNISVDDLNLWSRAWGRYLSTTENEFLHQLEVWPMIRWHLQRVELSEAQTREITVFMEGGATCD